MQSHQNPLSALQGMDASPYSYALKPQASMLPMLGATTTELKGLAMGISPYLTPPHSSIELDMGVTLPATLNGGSPNSNAMTGLPPTTTSPPPPSSSAPLQQQIAISTAFYPGSTIFGRQFVALNPDLVVQSGDGVFFYVHLALLGSKTRNAFGGMLAGAAGVGDPVAMRVYMDTPLLTPDCSEPTPPASPLIHSSENARPSTSSSSSTPSAPSVATPPSNPVSEPALPTLIAIPESSGVINILFHVLYNTTSFGRYSPDFDTISAVLPTMKKYGFDVAEMLGLAGDRPAPGIASGELVQTVLGFAAERPLDVYTLAAQYQLRELAVAASPYTLDVSLSQLTDAQSVAMGPLYLKWLFFLHFGRSEALKRILVKPFEHHAVGIPGATCTEDDRGAMGRAWGLVTAYILSLPNTQNVSVGSLSTTYGGLVGSVKCARCKEQLGRTIEEVVRGWGGVQATI